MFTIDAHGKKAPSRPGGIDFECTGGSEQAWHIDFDAQKAPSRPGGIDFECTGGSEQARGIDFERTGGPEQACSIDFERTGGAEQACGIDFEPRRHRAGLGQRFRAQAAPSRPGAAISLQS